MGDHIVYRQIPMEEWDFPVRIAEYTPKAEEPDAHDGSVHWHEQLEFQYVLSGGLQVACHGQTAWVWPGDVFFANWCEPHHIIGCLGGTRCRVVQFDPQWLVWDQDARLSGTVSQLMLQFQQFSPFIRQDAALCGLLTQMVSENTHRRAGYEMAVKALGMQLVVHLLRTYLEKPAQAESFDATTRYTREVLHYLVHHYNQPLELDGIARQIGLNKYYLCRVFRQHTGCTVIQYLNKLRCSMALSIIASGASVTKAAQEVGFDDYNYFSRVFKKETGHCPSEIARRAAEKIAAPGRPAAPSAADPGQTPLPY